MNQAKLDISVIICAYTEDRWDDLVAAVESVQRQTLLPDEIIVVIDHNPGLLRRVQENLSSVITIENYRDKGLSGARNSGWKTARGEIVAFLDDDAVAWPDWLESLVVCYTNPHVVGVGGKIAPQWESSHPSWFPDEFNWVIGCTHDGIYQGNAQTRNVIGANMSIRRDILIAIDGFRESFGCDKDTNKAQGTPKWFHHYAGDEETEFCIRVTQQIPDSVWIYGQSAVVQHQVSIERARWAYFLWRCYDEGLGKASLVGLHGIQKGLSTEITYTFKTLPRGIIHAITDAFLHNDVAGFTRAGNIVVGLTVTAIGFLVGNILLRAAKLRDIILLDGVLNRYATFTRPGKV